MAVALRDGSLRDYDQRTCLARILHEASGLKLLGSPLLSCQLGVCEDLGWESQFMQAELDTFLTRWEDNALRVKKSFVLLKNYLAEKDEVAFAFKARPGVSYSLRVRHREQTKRELFVIMDVIDEPDNRWLSICFYPDMITDPGDKGVLIPLGLLGEDGYCFDFEEWNEEYLEYLKTRLDEAYNNAAKEFA